ncbi:MAG: FkbM family methyltransferase [Haliea sp.]|nr:FkbM family methyltransferase [Haliea sp.]
MSRIRKGINKSIARYGYRIEKFKKPDFFELLLHYYLTTTNGELSFIQIGANDGVRYDPIFRFVTNPAYRLNGLVIEPVPRFYKALCNNYAKYDGIVALNLAVHNELKTSKLYAIGEEHEGLVPQSALGMASFNREHLLRPDVPQNYIKEIEVPCASLAEIAEKYHLNKFDLLQIDTEGYDAEIILGMDFQQVKPKLIHFEHGIRDGIMSMAKFESVISHLNDNGYQVLPERYDAIAFTLEFFSAHLPKFKGAIIDRAVGYRP